jgi:hypothetical protein
MISTIQNAPANVAAFRATGEVTKHDYDSVLIPGIEALLKQQDKINFLFVVDTNITNFTVGALLQDLGVGLKHFTEWNKMAIVSEQGGVVKFTDFFNYIAPGQAKGFSHAELEEAKNWVSS